MSTRKRRQNKPHAILRTPSGEKLVAAGRLGRPHGVRGEIRLDPLGGLPHGLEGYTRFFIDKGETPEPVELDGWRFHDKLLLVAFESIMGRDEVASLTGRTLYVPRSELPPLEEGEYYHVDVEGSSVIDDETGEELGIVVDIKDWGDYDMLFIRSGKKLWMLPVLEEYVKDMDLESSVIRVLVPEGIGP